MDMNTNNNNNIGNTTMSSDMSINENENNYVNIESIVLDTEINNKKNIFNKEMADIQTKRKNSRPLFSGPSNNTYSNINNNLNQNIDSNYSMDELDHSSMKRCDSNQSNCSKSSKSSKCSSNNCNSCDSKTPININRDDMECDIVQGSLFNNQSSSSETIIEEACSSYSSQNNLYDKGKYDDNKGNDDNIILINDSYSLTGDNNLNYNFSTDNMTTVSNGTNNFSDLMREELEPTSTAWNIWKIWCAVKIVFSISLILFGTRAIIIDNKRICEKSFEYFTFFYNVVGLSQIIINALLIIYLPHKIYQINYEMHRRLFISKILWGIQAVIDVFQLTMIPIGIKVLKGTSNICFDGFTIYNSSTYNFIYYITMISCCIYILFVTLLLVIPCWTLFMLLPKYEGVSMSQFRKISTIEVTNEILEHEPYCVICMEPFKLNAKVKQLPCSHIYHKNCISIWFADHNKCPTCRYEID